MLALLLAPPQADASVVGAPTMSREPSLFVKTLSSEDQAFLKETWHSHPVFTVRCRAHAILLSNDGYSATELTRAFQICIRTARSWIERWNISGRDGLYDEPRPGGPPILSEEERQVVEELIRQYPRDPRRVLRLTKAKTGKDISRTTLRRIANSLNLVWKRVRRVLSGKPSPEAVDLAEQEIAELEALPDVDVVYFDEAAFNRRGVVPYAWQPIGERLSVPIGPSSRSGFSVLGILKPDQTLVTRLQHGTVSGETVEAFLDNFSTTLQRTTVLIMDNASVHTSGRITEAAERWAERRLIIYNLPPYSPQLNDIEPVWKDIKYRHLPLTAWETLTGRFWELVRIFRDRGTVDVTAEAAQAAIG